MLFKLRQKYKDEHNDFMQKLINLLMISLCGEIIRKDVTECYKCKSE